MYAQKYESTEPMVTRARGFVISEEDRQELIARVQELRDTFNRLSISITKETDVIETEIERTVENEANAEVISAIDKEEPIPQLQIPDSQKIDAETELPQHPVGGTIISHLSPLVPRVQFQEDLVRMVDEVMGFAIDDCFRGTQLFDPGGFNCIKDSGVLLFGSHQLEAQVRGVLADSLIVGVARESQPEVLHHIRTLLLPYTFSGVAQTRVESPNTNRVWKPGGPYCETDLGVEMFPCLAAFGVTLKQHFWYTIADIRMLNSQKKKWWIKEFAWFQKLHERKCFLQSIGLVEISDKLILCLGDEARYGVFFFHNWTVILEGSSLFGGVDCESGLGEVVDAVGWDSNIVVDCESGLGDVFTVAGSIEALLVFISTQLQQVSVHIWLPERMFSLLKTSAQLLHHYILWLIFRSYSKKERLQISAENTTFGRFSSLENERWKNDDSSLLAKLAHFMSIVAFAIRRRPLEFGKQEYIVAAEITNDLPVFSVTVEHASHLWHRWKTKASLEMRKLGSMLKRRHKRQQVRKLKLSPKPWLFKFKQKLIRLKIRDKESQIAIDKEHSSSSLRANQIWDHGGKFLYI